MTSIFLFLISAIIIVLVLFTKEFDKERKWVYEYFLRLYRIFIVCREFIKKNRFLSYDTVSSLKREQFFLQKMIEEEKKILQQTVRYGNNGYFEFHCDRDQAIEKQSRIVLKMEKKLALVNTKLSLLEDQSLK